MKTTLYYNTIESLQRQKAWKTFLNKIVDFCNGLYDGNLVAEVDSEREGLPITQLKLSESEESLQAKYALLGFYDDIAYMTGRESISLRGLLHTLALYRCRIKNIKSDNDVLPHTFKVEGERKDTAIYGFDTANRTYDYECVAKTPIDATYGDEYDAGDVEADCFDLIIDKNYEDENTRFKYIYNVYGYNQKNPVLSISPMREVYVFYTLNRKSDAPSSLPQYLYIQETDAHWDEDADPAPTLVIANYSHLYKSQYSDDSGIYLTDVSLYDASRKDIIDSYYQSDGTTVRRWIANDEETSYVINDNDKYDLIKDDKRIKYNSDEHSLDIYRDLRFGLVENSNIDRADFKKCDGVIGRAVVDPQGDVVAQQRYYVYEDSAYGRQWVILDSIADYFTINPRFFKSQLFADECAVKAQPLLKYVFEETSGESTEEVAYLSECANIVLDEEKEYEERTGTVIDYTGGVGKLSCEVEMYNFNQVVTKLKKKNNKDDGTVLAQDVFYGDWYNLWAQYNDNATFFFKNDFYTALNFTVAEPALNLYSLDNFFDGKRKTQYISGQDKEVYANNNEKRLNGYAYQNAFKQEYFETMYFNHFVKIYPVVDEESDGLVSTLKLYCDNLELVMFGDIVPYVVTFDRIGEEAPESSEEVLNDIDCSVFSKILSYNKRTHLITVNNPVTFRNSKLPKYAVIAYQNASPFNKISSMDVITPNVNKDGVLDEELTLKLKGVVSDLLTDYTGACALHPYAQYEY